MSTPEIRTDLPEGVVEWMKFRGKYGVRIRRVGVGDLGRYDPNGLGPYVLEHREPGDIWRRWGQDHASVHTAQLTRYTIWGGPKPQ